MDLSLIYALLSLAFAGVKDFLFKKQAISGNCSGRYLAVVGMVSAVVFSLMALLQGRYAPTLRAVGFGVLVGVVLALSNYLLIKSMRTLDAVSQPPSIDLIWHWQRS